MTTAIGSPLGCWRDDETPSASRCLRASAGIRYGGYDGLR